MSEMQSSLRADGVNEVVSVMSGRVETYQMLSRLFLKPLSEAEIEGLASMGLEKLAQDCDGSDLLRDGLNDMGRGLHRRHTGTRRVLSTDYTMCFDGISSLNDERAVPYASVFNGAKTGSDAELFQEPRKADKRAYASEGIAADTSLNLPEDHLSFELSFMADLSTKVIDALQSGDPDEAARLIAVSEGFLKDNILSWYPKLYDLAVRIVDTRFYRGVLKMAYGYLLLDVDVLSEAKLLLVDKAA